MKSNILIIFIILLLFLNCSSNDYYLKTTVPPITKILNIAVIPENWDEYWVTSFAYRALITELLDVGFTVIERSQLIKVLSELELQQSGIVKQEDLKKGSIEFKTLDKNSIKKLGEILGVDAFLLVYVVPYDQRKIYMGTFRLVDVETSKVLTSSTIITEGGTDTDILMQQAALDIAGAYKNKKKIIHDNLTLPSLREEDSKRNKAEKENSNEE